MEPDLPCLRYGALSPVESRLPPERFTCTADRVGSRRPIYWCRGCQVGFSPSSDARELAETYAEVEDPAYFDEEDHCRRNAQLILAIIEKWQCPGTIVELGSGPGTFLAAARDRGWKARGFEPSRWAVNEGRARYQVDLHQGTVETVDIRRGSVDCLIMLDVLEHLEDPQGALQKCTTWLVPGGLLAVATVNMGAPLARLLGPRWPGFMDMHITYFTMKGLTAMAHRAGLRLVLTRALPRNLSADYLGTRLAGSGWLLGGLATILRAPLICHVSVPLRTTDLILMLATSGAADSTALR